MVQDSYDSKTGNSKLYNLFMSKEKKEIKENENNKNNQSLSQSSNLKYKKNIGSKDKQKEKQNNRLDEIEKEQSEKTEKVQTVDKPKNNSYDNKIKEDKVNNKKDEVEKETEQSLQKAQKEDSNNKKSIADKAKENSFSIERDIRDQALGQIYKIPGANIDYDELSKMAKNNIRDASELANESIQNDGFTGSVDEVKKAMSGYVNEGKPDINEIVKMSKTANMNTMAKAFTEVVKESCSMDAGRLSNIHDACEFDQPGYEAVFDRIRCFDKQADLAFDDFEMDLGREREY